MPTLKASLTAEVPVCQMQLGRDWRELPPEAASPVVKERRVSVEEGALNEARGQLVSLVG